MDSDLISRKALLGDLLKTFCESCDSYGGVKCRACLMDDAIGYVENAPTVDAVEVVHGEWEECDWVKYDGHGECVHYPKAALRCSNCCTAFKKELLWKDNYCPNCGADMRGEDK